MVWKREEPLRPTSVPVNPVQAPSYPPVLSGGFDQPQGEQRAMNEELASIGKSIVINGELSGSEDLTIEGQVEGKIELRDHVLTVGSNGHIKAQVTAKVIVVLGHVTGNLTATERVDIKENGSVEGDIIAPRVAIADGSHFRGSIDMQKKDQPVSVGHALGTYKSEKSEKSEKSDKSDKSDKSSVPAATSVTNDYARV